MNSKKRKERNQMIKLAIAVGVLLLLIVLYFVISNTVGGDGEDTSPIDTQEPMDIGTFSVLSETYGYMTELSYTYDGNTLKFERENDSWLLSDDKDFPLDQQAVIYMAQAISDFGGFRRFPFNESSIESYGFDEPLYDISATYTKNGKAYTNRVRIGDKNELTGYYYFYLDGSDYVYMVNNALSDYFSKTKASLFMSYEFPNPDVKDITAITVTTGEKIAEIEIPEAAAKKDEDGNIKYSHAEKIMSAMYHNLHLDYRHHVAYKVSDDKKADYGLDEPSLSVKLDYVEYKAVSTGEGTSGGQMSYDAAVTVTFGDLFTVTEKDKDGKESEVKMIYFMTDYDSIVYSVDYETYLEIIAEAGLESGSTNE